MQSSNLKTLTRLYIEQQTVQVTSSLDFHGHMLKKKRHFLEVMRWWRAYLMLSQYRNLNYEVIECIDKTNISHLSVKLWRCHTIRLAEASFNSDHTIDFPALIALCYFTDFPWQGDCQAQTAFIHWLLMIAKSSLYFWEYFIDQTEKRSIPLRHTEFETWCL